MSGPASSSRTYTTEITQMLTLFGEVAAPDAATVGYIQDLVRLKMSDVVVQARNLAARRRSPVIAAEDVLFLLRKDPAKVTRLKSYLAWRNLRCTTMRGDADIGLEDGETLIIDEMDEDEVPAAALEERQRSSKRVKISTPWDLVSSLLHQAQDSEEEHEEDLEPDAEEMERRRLAEDLTKEMTEAEYLAYFDRRTASFNYKKITRFQEFLNLKAHLDCPPSDEAVDCFSFIAYELVRASVTQGLASKAHDDPAAARRKRPSNFFLSRSGSMTPSKKPKVDAYASILGLDDDGLPKPVGPFSPPEEEESKTRPSRSAVSLAQAMEGERLANAALVKRLGYGPLGRKNYVSLKVHPPSMY